MASSLRNKIDAAAGDEIVPDFSEAREKLDDLEPIPPGTYEATVIECETGTSGKGNPKVVFKFELDDPVEGCWPTAFKHCPYTGGGSGIFRDVVDALGYDIAALESGKERFKCSTAIDRKAVLVIAKQKDDPEKTEVRRVKAHPSSKPAAKRTTTAKPAAKRTRKVG